MAKNVDKPKPYTRVSVIGAGAWGTALAGVLAQVGHEVMIWAREPHVAALLREWHENRRHLPGVRLPDSVSATTDIARACEAEILVLAVPAQHVRDILARLPDSALQKPIVVCAKGIERTTGKLLHEILREAGCMSPALLSGPSFAHDVAVGLPTAVTIAADVSFSSHLQGVFAHPSFRPYASDDLIGVALGGAAKNVYAIACGTVAGMRLGESARAALIARSFAELSRLALALGARTETLMGLSGLGDLVLTATSASSRNYTFGLKLGSGVPVDQLKKPGGPLAEGVETAPALVARAKRAGVELPIAEVVTAVLDGTLAPADAIPRLMQRPYRSE